MSMRRGCVELMATLHRLAEICCYQHNRMKVNLEPVLTMDFTFATD